MQKLFVDVAYHEGEIDWKQAAAAGVTEAYFRIGTGGYRGSIDPTIFHNIIGVRMVGIHFGFYHVPVINSPEPMISQVRFIAEFMSGPIAKFCRWVSPHFPLMADWEAFQDRSQIVNRTRIALYHREVGNALGIPVGVYTRASWWDRWVGHVPLPFQNECLLWLAQPGRGGIATEKPPTVPKSWLTLGRTWDIHQYSWKGRIPGIPGEVDLNRRREI